METKIGDIIVEKETGKRLIVVKIENGIAFVDDVKEQKLEEVVEYEDNICEWCSANLTKGEECDDMAHYLNR